MGIIAGGKAPITVNQLVGMQDGVVTLWDPRKIFNLPTNNNAVEGESQQLKNLGGCVYAKQYDQQAISTLQFNRHKKNLLATGGSEVLIHDINNIKQPNVFKPGNPNYHEGSQVCSVAWNVTVPHILASTSTNGKIVVWDLKKNQAVFNMTDPSVKSAMAGGNEFFDYYGGEGQPGGSAEQTQTRKIVLAWNPEQPTQFLVATDDDQA